LSDHPARREKARRSSWPLAMNAFENL